MNVAATFNQLNRHQAIPLIAGVVAAVVWGVGAFLEPTQAVRSYLIGYIYWWEATVGCLGLLLLRHLVRSHWGAAAGPVAAAGVATLPVMAILFLPIAVGVIGLADGGLYPWTDAKYMQSDPHLEHKAGYLNPTFFVVRAGVYFAIWYGLGVLASRHEQTQSAPPWLRQSAGLGLCALVLATSFAAVDWVMSLEPAWHSTILGALVLIGGGVTAKAIIVYCLAVGRAPIPEGMTRPQIISDVGNLMLAFLMVWAYFSFSQYLIIWSGNLPSEVGWYAHRLTAGWQTMALVIVVGHFAVPFFLLLSSDLKRSPSSVAFVALLILAMHFVDVFWTVAPSFPDRHTFSVHYLDFVSPVAVGGFWLFLVASKLRRYEAVPAAPSDSIDQPTKQPSAP